MTASGQRDEHTSGPTSARRRGQCEHGAIVGDPDLAPRLAPAPRGEHRRHPFGERLPFGPFPQPGSWLKRTSAPPGRQQLAGPGEHPIRVSPEGGDVEAVDLVERVALKLLFLEGPFEEPRALAMT